MLVELAELEESPKPKHVHAELICETPLLVHCVAYVGMTAEVQVEPNAVAPTPPSAVIARWQLSLLVWRWLTTWDVLVCVSFQD